MLRTEAGLLSTFNLSDFQVGRVNLDVIRLWYLDYCYQILVSLRFYLYLFPLSSMHAYRGFWRNFGDCIIYDFFLSNNITGHVESLAIDDGNTIRLGYWFHLNLSSSPYKSSLLFNFFLYVNNIEKLEMNQCLPVNLKISLFKNMEYLSNIFLVALTSKLI